LQEFRSSGVQEFPAIVLELELDLVLDVLEGR
jgi:hypothetical protein